MRTPPPEITVPRCRAFELPVFPDPRGNLTVVEGVKDVPFDIARVFFLYDVPGGESRAGHAHHHVEQVLVALSGKFDVVLDDGTVRQTVTLERAYHALYLPNYVWREIENFSSGAVCLALASLPYDADEYIRDYDEFKRSTA